MPAFPGLASRVYFLGALFARLVPGALGVGDRSALHFNNPDPGVGHEDDQINFNVAEGVVVKAEAGDDYVILAKVPGYGLTDLALR
jgi:hypothetical protein